MREVINSNPMVQIAVIGVLILSVAFLFMTRMKSSSGDSGGDTSAAPAAPTDASAAGATGAGAAPAGAPSGASGAGAVATGAVPPASGVTDSTAAAPPTATGSAPTTTGSVSPEALEPGPGMPAHFSAAYDRGDAIALLIVRGGATDDKLVRKSVQTLRKPGVSIFVARAKDIAEYSRITQGVGVSQVPALVVVRPKKISGPTPQAEVSYGFRNAQGVIQAVNDALYTGRDDLPYSPG